MELKSSYLIIPSAGKSSRMRSNLPKNLVKVSGRSFINYLLEEVIDTYSQILIPIPDSDEAEKLYYQLIESRFLDKITFIRSVPGSGDAKAIIDAFNYMKKDAWAYVIWGDSFIQNKLILRDLHKMISNVSNIPTAFVPLTFEKAPYVEYLIRGNRIYDVKLSRYEGPIGEGLTDNSIFLLSYNFLLELKKLYSMNSDIQDFSLLKAFSDLSEACQILPIILNEKVSISFNNLTELELVISKLSQIKQISSTTK